MNFLEAFATALAPAVGATLGVDLFISRVPAQPSSAWWVKAYGGVPDPKSVSGGRFKGYIVQVFYRDSDTETIYNKLYDLETLLNGPGLEIVGFEVIETSCFTFPSDNDLDSEDRDIGLLQAQISIYKE